MLNLERVKVKNVKDTIYKFLLITALMIHFIISLIIWTEAELLPTIALLTIAFGFGTFVTIMQFKEFKEYKDFEINFKNKQLLIDNQILDLNALKEIILNDFPTPKSRQGARTTYMEFVFEDQVLTLMKSKKRDGLDVIIKLCMDHFNVKAIRKHGFFMDPFEEELTY